jgi:hypothetical protein
MVIAASLFMGCVHPDSPGSPSASELSARALSLGAGGPGTELLLPQAAAFAILGHSCGGIREKVYVTGFDPASGLPIGDAYIQTICGGSGRGGGYHSITYSAWVGVSWDFSGNAVASVRLATAPTVNPALTVTDAYGDSLANIGSSAYLVVPVPAAPSHVSGVQSGDQFKVAWAVARVNPAAVTSSILKATPVDSTASMLTSTIGGSAAAGLLGPLQPKTTYRLTVVNSTIGGSGPASDPISVRTAVASIAPSAPKGLQAKWLSIDPAGSADTLVQTWRAALPGDSPVDEYAASISGSDGAGKFAQTVSGTTLTASFTVDSVPNWTIIVRAHNAVGWGPWSASIVLGGL